MLEALCAFVRDGTKAKIDKDKTNVKGGPPPARATDIQAALTVIGRRKAGPGIVDLSGADLIGADLIDAHLNGANLNGANLSGADLFGADLSDANGVTQSQLDKACGSERTKLPSGLKIKTCP